MRIVYIRDGQLNDMTFSSWKMIKKSTFIQSRQ